MLGLLEVLTTQLDAGVPINMEGGDASSLFTAAAAADRNELFALLIARGADINHAFQGDTVRCAGLPEPPAAHRKTPRLTPAPTTAPTCSLRARSPSTSVQ